MSVTLQTVRQRLGFAAGAAVIITLALPAAALAQAPAGSASRWTVEVYGGAASNKDSSNGSAGAAFPAGAPFTTAANTPSRLQPSWYFGDGSTMLNQVIAAFSTLTGTTLDRIVPVDAAITTSATGRKSGGTFGLRVGRSLSAKLAVEFSAERNTGGQAFTDEALASLETTRASFRNAFQDLLETAPVTALSVSSTLATRGGSSSQTRLVGAVRYSLVSGGRTSAYVLAGGGMVMNGTNELQAILTGGYSFRMYGAFPLTELDRAVITVTSPSSSALGLVGGGVTYDFSSNVGLRVDVRLALSPNGDEVSITGAPSVTAGVPPNVLPAVTTPAVQFSTIPGVPSSLGATVPAHTTFIGSGMNRQVSFTVGIFRRF